MWPLRGSIRVHLSSNLAFFGGLIQSLRGLKQKGQGTNQHGCWFTLGPPFPCHDPPATTTYLASTRIVCEHLETFLSSFANKVSQVWQVYIIHDHAKHTAWNFPLDFQLLCLPEETCFQQEGSFVVEGTNQVVQYWDRLTIVQYIVVSSSRKNTKPNGGRASFPRKAQILPFTYIARLLLIQRRVNGGSTD